VAYRLALALRFHATCRAFDAAVFFVCDITHEEAVVIGFMTFAKHGLVRLACLDDARQSCVAVQIWRWGIHHHWPTDELQTSFSRRVRLCKHTGARNGNGGSGRGIMTRSVRRGGWAPKFITSLRSLVPFLPLTLRIWYYDGSW
jgi:hypothetical protein